MRCHLRADGIRQARQGELACRVGGKVRHGNPPSDRADVHDAPEAAPAHRRQNREHQIERPLKVRGHRVVEVLVLHVLERADLDDAGVVDQDVHSAPGGKHLLDGCSHIGFVADVTPDGHDLRAMRLFQHPLGAVELTLVTCEQHQPCSLDRQLSRQNQPEPAGPAGNQNDPPAEVDRAARARDLRRGVARCQAGGQPDDPFLLIVHRSLPPDPHVRCAAPRRAAGGG